MLEMDKRIKDAKCSILKETCLRVKIINEMEHLYVRYRKNVNYYEKKPEPIIDKQDIEYFAKLKKELEEIEEENEKILDGLKKDYGISWEKIRVYYDDERFDLVNYATLQDIDYMKEYFARFLCSSPKDELQQEFCYLYKDFIKYL